MSDGRDLLTQLAGIPPHVFEAQLTETGVTLHVDEVTLRESSSDSGWRVNKSWRGVDRGLLFEATNDADVARYVLATPAGGPDRDQIERLLEEGAHRG